MRTEIINIGDELLIGQVVNTNASWMAERMNLSGFAVNEITVIGDDGEDIMLALKNAAERSDIVIITGGLGPTKDDITKKVFCRFFNTKLIFDEDVFSDIERLFRERGYGMTPLNRAQAEIPSGCIPLRNKNGTAPGMWFETPAPNRSGNVIMVSLPGVPFEMKGLIEDEVIPRLNEKFSLPVIIHKTILTQGKGESFLSDLIEPWELSLPENIKLAYLPQPGLVRLRLTGTGTDEKELRDIISAETVKLRGMIGEYVYGEDDDTLESITGRLLKERKETLSSAESCTGGYIAHMITSVPGSSAYFKGGVIAYSNDIKQQELGVKEETLVSFGAVSEQVVCEMASGIRERFGTTYSVATSGIAGPGGGSEEKPVGLTWIAVASPSEIICGKYLLGDNRERNIRKAALQALNLLRKQILKEKIKP